ncbi:hypothetical protein [Shewanella psychrophila]|uniref:hypothetical protein n=1 Tax=Shewanella psychrophila TaxID=225848 RepID=UPI00098AE41A|nr:hypothetical protein [Shewanella psychrophila]
MNQPYRVRLKTKTKVRLTLILVVFVLMLGFFLFQLLKFDFGLEPDEIRYGKRYLLKPILVQGGASYKAARAQSVGRFKLPSNKVVYATIYAPSHDSFYCVVEVLVNGKVSHYQSIQYERCV